MPPAPDEKHFREKSFWLSQGEYQPSEPLSENIKADVVVIGGGFTGLSAALNLKERDPGIDVVLLEREVIGFGASGRSGAFVSTPLNRSLDRQMARHGEDAARRGYLAMIKAVDYVGEVVEKYNLECGYEKTGILTIARGGHHQGALRRDEKNFHRLGFKDVRLLDAAELKQELNITGYHGALYEPDCALIDPARLCREYKRLLVERGVRIHEHTPALKIEDGANLRVQTARGEVEAGKAVVATNAYIDRVSCLARFVMPIWSYIVITEPLDRARMDAIGWKNRQGVETQRYYIHYLRLTSDNRIMIGGELYPYGYNNRLIGMDTNEYVFRRLRATLKRMFPDLRGIGFSHMWGGPIAVSASFTPTINVAGARGNIYYAGAYCGHGVSLGNLAGKILADMIFGEDGSYSDLPFFRNRLPAMPGEPWRYLGRQVTDRVMRFLDWYHDRL